MADYVSSNPTTIAANALFNWDEFGYSNFKISGTVNISVSNCFNYVEYVAGAGAYYYTYSDTNPMPTRSATQLANIDIITSTISKFANIKFNTVVDYGSLNPLQVGAKSDINICFVQKPYASWSGVSSINSDSIFGYGNAKGDISLNLLSGYDSSLSLSTMYGDTLMHEIGHSLGLSHPHKSYDIYGNEILTAGFAATYTLGFDKLGFHINSGLDMDKQYFTMMSYDEEYNGTAKVYSLTPMILDVMALQNVYGEGTGSSGIGDTTIVVGNNGLVDSYRTYFDLGGTDTIDLSNYSNGAYLHMGTTIIGATHLVGVSMSMSDGQALINYGIDPTSLRWFYGEFENAIGSISGDKIIGNSLNNHIMAGAGDDILQGGAGLDVLDGGDGNDTAIYSGNLSDYLITRSGSNLVIKGPDGRDLVSNVEQLQFDSSVTVSVSSLLASLTYRITQNDYNGDGNSDVLWRNPTNNLMGVWSVNNGQYSWNLLGQVSTTMNIAGTGDFNGDGTADVLWQDSTTGAVSLWSLVGGTPTISAIGTGSSTMQVAGIGDFNGDGSSDILWKNPTNNMLGVWSMQNGQPSWSLIDTGSTTMSVAGIGDFNGDGTSDVLWINPTNNLIGIWSMHNNQSSWSLIGQGSTTMKIAGIGDFNGDNIDDILWLNPTNNMVGIWSMKGNTPTWSLVGQGSTTMTIAAIGDYNADGTSDILWQNPTNNLLGTWSMTNNTPSWSLMGQGSTTMKVV